MEKLSKINKKVGKRKRPTFLFRSFQTFSLFRRLPSTVVYATHVLQVPFKSCPRPTCELATCENGLLPVIDKTVILSSRLATFLFSKSSSPHLVAPVPLYFSFVSILCFLESCIATHRPITLCCVGVR